MRDKTWRNMTQVRQPLSEQESAPASSHSSSSHVQQDDPLSVIIQAYFTQTHALRSTWSIQTSDTWIRVTHNESPLPEQGWKLHVSSGLSSAEAVLRAVLPVLANAQVSFKVACSLNQLYNLNHGFAGNSQVGKFIAIYPVDEAQAVQLAQKLDEVTQGQRGPTISSDIRLRPGSLVFYRYGAFKSKLMYTPLGVVVSVITTPSGELIEDTRRASDAVPSWLDNPFIASGVGENLEQRPHRLVGNRYLLLSALSTSPRGNIFLGVDVQGASTCILKSAERDAFITMSGKDAWDILRHEATMLRSLPPGPCFPAFFDLIEQGDTLYLVMEEVKGETMLTCVERAFARGALSPSLVIRWGRELAAILAKIHHQGLVYRDLKPSNVLIRDQHLTLIDFELVTPQGQQHTKRGVGTRGFMSPENQAGEAAHVGDDIYSLGALLYYLTTHAAPTHAADTRNLLARPLRCLYPDIPPALEEIITRCLDPVAERRFSSMSELETVLATLENSTPTITSCIAHDTDVLADTRNTARPQWLELARQLGYTLCSNARQSEQWPGLFWMSSAQSSEGMPLRAVNAGSCGCVLALAELVDTLQLPLYRQTLEEATRWLLHTDTLIANPQPGLYVGEAGIAAALLRAGQVLRDEQLIHAASEKGRWVAQQPFRSPDLMNGAAGRLRHHLLLWDETHEPEHLEAAIYAGEWLLKTAREVEDGGICWTLPLEYSGLTYIGYAHGTAGIADALLDLFDVTHDERLLTTIHKAYVLLERLAVPVWETYNGVNWPLYLYDKPHELAGPYWCHGAAGIGRFLLHLHEHGLAPQASELAARAAMTVAHGSRWANPNQCHGLAGNIEFLLDMFQATHSSIYRSESHALAFLLNTFASEQHGHLVWPGDTPEQFSPDYMIGYAGIVVCLLRLAFPDTRPHQLSRRGFRYTSKTSLTVNTAL